ncbi:hypothetical protein SCG7109_BK_00060 [Chlamydiales bacterium SCGC AG-110-M15]|nr:hypothetical protein SCG7109_BK_00060 [Chlamydiales bacterium SCGC AG-110-M15]
MPGLMRHLLLFTLISLLGGCHPHMKIIPSGSSVNLDNVYANPSYDHAQINNVLLLPIANPDDNHFVKEHNDRLRQSFIKNMAKFNYFYIQYDRDLENQREKVVDMESGSYDRLRLGVLGNAYNAQGILALSISEYRPFFPMTMRIRGTLFDANTGERIWSFDQVFDTDDATVENSMRVWWNSRMAGGDQFNRYELNKLRPSFFMNFVFHTMADTYGNSRVGHIETIAEEIKENKKKMEKIEDMQEDAFIPSRTRLHRL